MKCENCGEPVHLREIEKGNAEIVEVQANCPYPREVIIHGRRWFDSTYGNTYHSVSVEVDGEIIGVEPFAYGYDDQYQQTALEILIDEGILPKLTYENGFGYGLRRTCEKLGIDLNIGVYDVKRKRELHEPLEGSNV